MRMWVFVHQRYAEGEWLFIDACFGGFEMDWASKFQISLFSMLVLLDSRRFGHRNFSFPYFRCLFYWIQDGLGIGISVFLIFDACFTGFKAVWASEIRFSHKSMPVWVNPGTFTASKIPFFLFPMLIQVNPKCLGHQKIEFTDEQIKNVYIRRPGLWIPTQRTISQWTASQWTP